MCSKNQEAIEGSIQSVTCLLQAVFCPVVQTRNLGVGPYTFSPSFRNIWNMTSLFAV